MITPHPIDFYFDFISPFGYFASLRVDALAASFGREARWHGMLVGVSILKVMGLPPVPQIPLKGAYILRDASRYARRHSLRLKRDLAASPCNPLPPARSFAWAQEASPSKAVSLAQHLFHLYWAEDQDISHPDLLRSAFSAVGLDWRAYCDADAQGLPSSLLRKNVDGSLARGVFGSPFFIVGDEPFFGVEKMELLTEWLQTGGW